MSNINNLVKKEMIDKKELEEDKYIQTIFIRGDEWEIYLLSENTIMYVFFELTEDGLGYAFCVKIVCNKKTFEITPFYYAKSFGNFQKSEWTDCDDYIKNTFLFDAIHRLNVYGQK